MKNVFYCFFSSIFYKIKSLLLYIEGKFIFRCSSQDWRFCIQANCGRKVVGKWVGSWNSERGNTHKKLSILQLNFAQRDAQKRLCSS